MQIQSQRTAQKKNNQTKNIMSQTKAKTKAKPKPKAKVEPEIEVNTDTLVGMFNALTTLKRTGAGRPTAKKDEIAQIAQLKENDTYIIRSILQANFKDAVQFGLPQGKPPFNPNESEVLVTDSLIKELGTCTTVGAPGHPIKRERNFIDILEAVHKDDADLLILVKDKKLEEMYPTLTKAAVQAAWENLV